MIPNAQKGQILNPDLVRNAVTYLRRAKGCIHICEKEIFLKHKNEREREKGHLIYKDLLFI